MRLTEIGAFAQDSWRVTPTLTLNAGVRWEVQLPIVALNGNYSTATIADICGPSGLGDGPGGRACNLFQPGVFNAPGAGAAVHAVHGQRPPATRPTGTTSRRTSSVGVAAERAERLRCARSSAIRNRRPSAPAISIAYNRNGMAEFAGHLRAATRAARSTRTGTTRLGNLVAARRVVAGALPRHGAPRSAGDLHAPDGRPAAFRCRRSIRCSATTANSVNIFDPDIQLSYTQLVQRRLPARAVAGHGGRSPLRRQRRTSNGWTTRTGTRSTSTRTASSTSSSSRRRTCDRTSRPAAARRAAAVLASRTAGPAPARRRCRSTSRTSTAQNAANAGNAALYTGTNWTNTTFVGRLNPVRAGGRHRVERPVQQRDVPHEHGDRRPAGQLLGHEPAHRERQRPHERDVRRKYHSVQTRSAAPALAGPARERQLHVVAAVRLERSTRSTSTASARRADERAALDQAQRRLRAAVRPRQALRHGLAPVAWTASPAAGR